MSVIGRKRYAIPIGLHECTRVDTEERDTIEDTTRFARLHHGSFAYRAREIRTSLQYEAEQDRSVVRSARMALELHGIVIVRKPS